MKITLYEDVALRSDYSIVFDNDTKFWGTNTPFAQYLKSRNSYEEELDNVYFANDGSISISWPIYRTLPLGITYMRIITDNNETKYFFVDSYEYRNEILVLNYTLDVWSTYSNDMVVHSGIINRARYIPDGYRKTLPSTYQTNEALIFNGVESTFYLVAEFQVYRLTNDPQAETERYSYTSLISKRTFSIDKTETTVPLEPTKNITSNDNFRFTIKEATAAINALTAHQGIKPVNKYELGFGWGRSERLQNNGLRLIDKDDLGIYTSVFDPFDDDERKDIRYELTEIYALPYQIFSQSSFNTAYNAPVHSTITILDSVDTKLAGSDTYHFSEYHFATIAKSLNDVQFNISNSDKIVGIGTLSLFVPTLYNGIEQSVRIRSEINDFGFSIFMVGATGISDISSHFEIPIPYITPSGQERQIAALNKQAARRQVTAAAVGLAVGAVGIGLGAASTVATEEMAYASTLQNLAENAVYKSMRPAVQQYAVDLAASAANRKAGMKVASSVLPQGASFLYQGTSLINAVNKLQQPQSPGNPSDSTPIALLNAAYGFSTYTISPINQEEIDYMIARIGYETWIQSNDYHYSNDKSFLTNKYEPIQFATLQIHGSFPNNISSSLEQILLDGTLISYDPQIYNKL